MKKPTEGKGIKKCNHDFGNGGLFNSHTGETLLMCDICGEEVIKPPSKPRLTEGKGIKITFNKSQKKNLVSRRMHKILDKMVMNEALAKAEEINRIALETLAEQLKEKGIKQWEGNNYTLLIK